MMQICPRPIRDMIEDLQAIRTKSVWIKSESAEGTSTRVSVDASGNEAAKRLTKTVTRVALAVFLTVAASALGLSPLASTLLNIVVSLPSALLISGAKCAWAAKAALVTGATERALGWLAWAALGTAVAYIVLERHDKSENGVGEGFIDQFAEKRHPAIARGLGAWMAQKTVTVTP